VSELSIRPMTRAELDILVGWASEEGWNPGLSDAEIFWRTDPEAFIAAEQAGELIGGGSIVCYPDDQGRGAFGFMGFFIIRADKRHQGLGSTLWWERKRRLEARLAPDAVIGMDGVFDMQAWYARGGFKPVARDLRYEGIGRAAEPDESVVPLAGVPLAEVQAYDARHFPTPRPGFVQDWINTEGHVPLGVVTGGRLTGYGVLRPCQTGFKIGPLFADTPAIAESLFTALSAEAPGQPIFLDTPEDNPAALQLAARHGLKEVFGCARMYTGIAPNLPLNNIYGVTTFELG
jgi:hypothetical protein